MELFRNRLGSVILAVSVSTGAIAAEYDYDSFGQRTLVQGTEEVRYGFTSREHDAETGLIYDRARTYDPATGTFLQRDPIGFASGDLNLYAYVENDPYNATDPSGLVDGALTTGRSAGMSRGLWTAFSGILGFAQRFSLELAALATGGLVAADLVLNQNDSDGGDGAPLGPGMGHNQPPGDDDGRQNPEPPDPLDPASAFIVTVAAATATIGEGNANKEWHFDRHFEGTDLNPSQVREAIRQEIDQLVLQGQLEPGSSVTTTIEVNGTTVEFRAFHRLGGGGINVGTAYVIR